MRPLARTIHLALVAAGIPIRSVVIDIKGDISVKPADLQAKAQPILDTLIPSSEMPSTAPVDASSSDPIKAVLDIAAPTFDQVTSAVKALAALQLTPAEEPQP